MAMSSCDVNLLQRNIFDLNDDCLLYIFQYFTAKELLNLMGKLCVRFDAIARAQLANFKRFKVQFREGHPFSFSELKLLGEYLISLDISVGYSIPTSKVCALLRPLSLHEGDSCIQELVLNYVYMNADYLECLIKMATNLKKSDLSFCNLTDELIEPFFLKCFRLKELILLGNYELGGKSLKCLQSLRKITVETHENWELDYAIMELKNPKLHWTIYNKGRSKKIDND